MDICAALVGLNPLDACVKSNAADAIFSNLPAGMLSIAAHAQLLSIDCDIDQAFKSKQMGSYGKVAAID